MARLYKTYYDIGKIVIWGEEGDQNRRPKLVLSFRDGNPRITVYTGVQGPEGVISFPSDYATMSAVVNLLKEVAKAPPGTKYSVDSLTTLYENNQPTNQKRLVSVLYIGKSKEGLVYLSVIAENRPKLVFTIKPSPYHVFRDENKNELPQEKISSMLAEGIAELIMNVISNILVDYTEEEFNELKNNSKPKATNGNSKEESNFEIVSSIDELDI